MADLQQVRVSAALVAAARLRVALDKSLGLVTTPVIAKIAMAEVRPASGRVAAPAHI